MATLFPPDTLLSLAFGYLMGSVPFGLLLTRAAGLGDIRRVGSGNIGATNVLRTGNKGLAALTLLLDATKGMAAVLLADHLGGQYAGNAIEDGLFAGLGAVLGHLFPLWLGFRGGKGVATSAGVLVALDWRAAVAVVGLWLATAMLTRYSSLAALIASIATPLILLALDDRPTALLAAIIVPLLVIKHRDNVKRLMTGEEPKIGARPS